MIVNPYNIQSTLKSDLSDISDSKIQANNEDFKIRIIDLLFENYRMYIEKNNIKALTEIITKELECTYGIGNKQIIKKVIEEIIAKIFGYGILQKYIDDIEVSDIRVVKFNLIYIKKSGTWEKADEEFESSEAFNEYIRFCAIKNNIAINTENPVCIFSDRKNSLRLEAGIAPANIDNDNLVIRIHRRDKNSSLEELLIKYNMIDVDMYNYLLNEVISMKSFIICGKGGSGKTTLMKALLEVIPDNIAITSLEETAELFLSNGNVIQRECILNRSQESKVDLDKLAKHSLVMSNDVIVLGELKRF